MILFPDFAQISFREEDEIEAQRAVDEVGEKKVYYKNLVTFTQCSGVHIF